MAVACSIFTLGGWVQLFWTAFDMPITVVPLEVALGWQKFYFWAFKKIILMHLLMVPLSEAYQKLPKTTEPPHLK